MYLKVVQNDSKWSKVGKGGPTERQTMLLGQYDGKIDQKGRTAFPKKFRETNNQ